MIKTKKFKKFAVFFISIIISIPILSVNVFAVENFYNQVRPNEAPVTLYYTGISNAPTVTPNAYGWYQFSNAALENNLFLNFIFYSTWDIAFDSVNYDYYYNLIVESPNADPFTFFPNQTRITELGANQESIVYTIPNNDVLYSNFTGRLDGKNTIGFSVLAKFPDNFQGSLRSFYVADVRNSSGGSIPANLRYSITVIQTQKDASAEYVQSIVNAINNQTNVIEESTEIIEGSVNNQTDIIVNGTDDTDSTVSDFNEVFDDFNDRIVDWEEFDDSIISDWNDANTEYQTQLSDFNLSTSLLKAGNWLSTSMQYIYDDSSDYKMLWLVPLLFGIPILLFVIRKGSDDE